MRIAARLVLVALASLIGALALADEASHRRAAEDLLVATAAESTMNASIDQMMAAQLQLQPQLAPFRDVMRGFIEQNVGYAAMKDEMIALYVGEFTEPELVELAAFYRTPTGSKAIAKVPTIMARSVQISMARMQARQGELVKLLEDEVKRRGGAR